MSKRTIVGALLAVLVMVVIYFFQSRQPPSPTQTPSLQPIGEVTVVSDRSQRPAVPQPAEQVKPEPTLPSAPLGASISGTVRINETNAPAAGVLIKASTGRSGSTLTQTDQKGSYTLAGLVVPAEGARFSVIADGEQSELFMLSFPVAASVRPGEAKSGVNFILHQGRNGSIVGKVVGRRMTLQEPESISSQPTVLEFAEFEKAEDTPWSGVKVVVEGMNVPSRTPQGQVRKETFSDGGGCFRFEGLRADYYTVWAERPEGAALEFPSPSEAAPPGEDFVGSNPRVMVRVASGPTSAPSLVFRRDGVSVMGRVTDPDGRPIKGARVAADLIIPEGAPSRRGMASAFSDEGGRYRLRPFPSAGLLSAFRYVAAERVSVKYELTVQAEGHPPGHVTVLPVTENAIIQACLFIEMGAKTGLFKSDMLKGYEPRLRDFELKLKQGGLPNSKGDVITVDIVLQKEAVVAGCVLDTRGKPVSRPRGIYLIPKKSASTETDGAPPPKPIGSALDKEGRFSFKGVTEGIYFFQISNPPQNARDRILEVHAGETIENLELVVEAAEDRGNVTGLVLEAGSAKPIDVTGEYLAYGGMQHTRVEITRVDSPQEPTPARGNVSTFKAEKGVFLIEGISPGSATLQLSPKGYVSVRNHVQVVSGQTTKEVFYLAPRGAIAGRVLDAQSGTPITTITLKVANVDSVVEKPASSGNVMPDPSREGAFLIADISPGTATLEILATGYGREIAEVGIVGGATTEKTFRLGSEQRLSGYITYDGQPGKADVSVWRVGGKSSDAMKTQSDGTGSYEIKGLKEGEYWVRVSLVFQNTPRATRIELARVNVTAGDTRLDFGFPDTAGIRGTFTCPDGTRHTGLLVFDPRRDPSFPEPDRLCSQFWATAKESWNYEVKALPPGTYTIIGKCRKLNQQTPFAEQSKTISLGAGQIEQVDFIFPKD